MMDYVMMGLFALAIGAILGVMYHEYTCDSC